VLIGHYEDPKDFLRALMNEGKADMRLRAQAAVALMPFEHKKLGDGTKKDDAAKKAEAVSAGRFGARPPPLKRVA
jgi:phage terminase small subunit